MFTGSPLIRASLMTEAGKPMFKLDPRLQDDTHVLVEQPDYRILLHRNSAVMWLILVPDTELQEFFLLPQSQQQLICRMMQRLSGFIMSGWDYDKINLGMIGNVVAQLHVHVIGRRHDDPYWPDPVWGRPPGGEYSTQQVIDIRQKLTGFLDAD